MFQKSTHVLEKQQTYVNLLLWLLISVSIFKNITYKLSRNQMINY